MRKNLALDAMTMAIALAAASLLQPTRAHAGCEALFFAPSAQENPRPSPTVDAEVRWDNSRLWDQSIAHANGFFIDAAWDDGSGSVASRISSDGRVLGPERDLIASSRMAYGFALGAEAWPYYAPYAERQAAFVLNKMVSSSASEAGHEARAVPPYFLSIVDPAGARIGEQGPLVVNEQAYGFNGLVARLRRSGDPALYRRLRELYEAFYARFHDERGGGFFDQFDLASGQAVKTKSYNSTVYVATSFLLELALLDSAHQGEYLATARELADLVATRFLDPSTGWIVENFTADWAPDWRGWQRQAVVDGNGGERIVSIGVVGHNFQAAWFLLRAAELPGTAPERAEAYLAAARSILHSMLGSAAVDWADGGVLDSFRREDGIPMWNSNKAWWQQAEAMMALTHADRIGLFADSGQRIRAARARDQILQFYFAHFIDAKNGGEFPVVAKDGSPILSENKGALGTGSYHQVELAAFMKAYARRQQSDRALGASAGEAAGQSTARDKPTWYHVPPLLSGPVAAPDFLRLPAK